MTDEQVMTADEERVARMAHRHRLDLVKHATADPPKYCLKVYWAEHDSILGVFGDDDDGRPSATLDEIEDYLRSDQANNFHAILKNRSRTPEIAGPDDNLLTFNES